MTPALRQNLTLAVLVLTGINMRPLLTSIGPLLPDIRAASGMSYTLAALLTALPVIAMGVLALAAGWVDRYIGQKRSIALSLLIIAAGALLREIAPNSGLLLTSALAGGIGIGIIQAAIPAVIKQPLSPTDAAGDGTMVSGADGRRRVRRRVHPMAGVT